MVKKFQLSRRDLLTIGLSAFAGRGANALSPSGKSVPLLVGSGTSTDSLPPVLHWFARQLGIVWEVRAMPWARAILEASAGEGLMYGLARSVKREQKLRFSIPICNVHAWAVVRDNDVGHVRTMSDLSGETVCWTRGSAYLQAFQDAGVNSPKISESNNNESALRMVAAGRCRIALLAAEESDVTVAAQAFQNTLKQAPGTVLIPTPVFPMTVHFAAARQSPWSELIDRIDTIAADSRSVLQQCSRP